MRRAIGRMQDYRARGCLLLAMALLLAGFAQAAFAGNLFEVRNVQVDSRARTADAARVQALAQGQRMALAQLLRRITRQSDWPVLPDVATLDVENFVLNFQLRDEKNSTRRYLARLTVQFAPEQVLAMLQALNIPYTETQAKPALLLPVLEDETGYHLWDGNWWQESWSALELANIPAPMVLAAGDDEDNALLSIEDILLGDTQNMARLAARYAADTVIIAHATAMQPYNLDVSVYQYSAQGSRLFVRHYEDRQTWPVLGGQAAQALLDAFSADWKAGAIVHAEQQARFTLAADYDRMGEWLTMIDRLQQASFIKKMDIHVLTSRGAILSFSYTGSIGQLISNLAQNDMLLRETENGWRLKLQR